MVSTRSHPKSFSSDPPSSSNSSPTQPTQWAHTPSNLLLLWLAISLPLVAWDTGYVLLRPHSMPGGWAHAPLWIPYELYGRIDHVYGWEAYDGKNGFTGAQGMMNLIETTLYVIYVAVLYFYGTQRRVPGRGAPGVETVGRLGWSRVVYGGWAGWAVMILFAAAVMTLSKTLLYGLHEYYSGFENIGHNSMGDVILLWIVPNGMWVVFPAYMTYVAGSEILEGLSIAAGESAEESSLKKTS